MFKKFFASFLILVFTLYCSSVNAIIVKRPGVSPMHVAEGEVVDAEYLQSVLNYNMEQEQGVVSAPQEFMDTAKESFFWFVRSYGKIVAQRLVNYMRENNLVIAPGEYDFGIIYCCEDFQDGFFLSMSEKFLWSKPKIVQRIAVTEVFNFVKKI